MAVEIIIVYFFSFLGLYLSIFFLLTILGNRKQLYRIVGKRNFPSVAIIVPCFNEEKTVAQTIESLLNLDYPKGKLEVLVIDDGSTDQTFAVAQSYTGHSSVRVFHKVNGGKHTAMNLGLRKTSAELVGYLDADSFADRLAVKKMIPYFDNPNTQAVTGSLKVFSPQNFLQHIQSIEYLFGVYLRKCFSLMGSLYVAPGPLTLFRREIYQKIGYYRRAHNTEDMEIALRLQKDNYQIENALDSYVYTVTPSKFKELYHQRVRWYQGLLRNGWDYRKMFFSSKQGTLGFILLPAISLNIFALMVLTGLFFLQIGRGLINFFQIWNYVGLQPHLFSWRLEWFFINTQAITFISIILILVTLSGAYLGKRLSRDHSRFFSSLFLNFIFYTPLYLIWWAGALVQVASGRRNSWVKRKD